MEPSAAGWSTVLPCEPGYQIRYTVKVLFSVQVTDSYFVFKISEIENCKIVTKRPYFSSIFAYFKFYHYIRLLNHIHTHR